MRKSFLIHHFKFSDFDSLMLDILRLFMCNSCLFSLASFAFLANNLAYSAASCLPLAARAFLRESSCLFRCSLCGVTRRWILGALVFGFLGWGLPSLTSIGRLMTLSDIIFFAQVEEFSDLTGSLRSKS